MHSVQTLHREHSNRRRRTYYLPYQPASGIRATGSDVNCEQLSMEHYINIYYNIITLITSEVGCARDFNEPTSSVAATFEWNSDIWFREFLFCVLLQTKQRVSQTGRFRLCFVFHYRYSSRYCIVLIVQVFRQISITRFFLLTIKPYFCLF